MAFITAFRAELREEIERAVENEELEFILLDGYCFLYRILDKRWETMPGVWVR
jgi:hypothetical protein